MFTIDNTLGGLSCQVFLVTGVTDLRRGFNGLYAMIEHELSGDPLSGKVYVFCNRKRDAVKVFFYHDGGLWVCAKRLEQGTFRWPERGERTIQMTPDELQRLLTGMDVIPVRVRDRWWKPSQSNTIQDNTAPQTSPGSYRVGGAHVQTHVG